MPAKIQALFFAKNLWSREAAEDWCTDHSFITSDQSETSESWIFRQFSGQDENAEYRIIADDFPSGISASVLIDEDKGMKNLYKTGVQSAADKFTYIMSTNTVDRMDDVIEQNWVLDDFQKNPIALFNHDHDHPIGVWENVKVETAGKVKRLVGTLKLAAKGTSELIDTIRALVDQGILRAVSVGFQPVEFVFDKDLGGYRFKKTELWECSLVSVPANAEALALAKGLGLSQRAIRQVLIEHDGATTNPDGRPQQRNHAEHGRTPLNKESKPMKIAEKIAAMQAEINEANDAMKAIAKSIEDENRDPTEDEGTKIEHYTAVVAEKSLSLVSLQTLEQSLAKSTEAPARPGVPQIRSVAAMPAENVPKDDVFVKMATLHLMSHMTSKNVGDLATEMYRDDARMQTVMRAAVNPADTVTPGWASQLVQTSIQGFLESLRGESLFAQLAPLGIPLTFGSNGSIIIPGWGGTGTDLAGSFVGEGLAIPVKKGTLTSKTINRYKMAVISTFTKEILRSSTPQIEGLVRQKIREDTAQALDVALMDVAAAVAGVRPASILNGAPTQAAAGTGSAADVITDMTWLYSQINANAGRRMVLMLHPRRAAGLSMKTNAAGVFMFRSDVASGSLMGARLLMSTHISPTVIALFDAADFANAADIPDFELSDVATIVEASDVAPAPLVGPVSGAAGTTPPTTVRSLFQTWSTALRMVMPLSWDKVRTDTIAYITGAAW